jgi:hypothetical protein
MFVVIMAIDQLKKNQKPQTIPEKKSCSLWDGVSDVGESMQKQFSFILKKIGSVLKYICVILYIEDAKYINDVDIHSINSACIFI